MSDTYKLREIFSRGMPTVTYVRREHLGLEQELRRAVAKGYAIVAVTGPSKCGKTVLRRTVIPDNVVAHIEGGQVSVEDDFWETIRAHLETPSGLSQTATRQTGGSAGIGASIGVPYARLTANLNESDSSGRTDTRTFTGPGKGQLLKLLTDNNDVLVVDDFHYIGSAIRAKIVRSLKSAVFNGLTVVMLSVPYRAFDVLTAEAEMEGRFTHLSIPVWSADDLIKIAEQGFPALGMDVDSEIRSRFAAEALGSPLLMQSLCAQLCSQLDIFKTEYPVISVKVDEIDLPSLYRTVARDFGLPAFTKLSAGPQSRTDRIPRKFVNGTTGDIYEAVLAAVAFSGAHEQTAYDDLRSALRDVLMETPPQKHEVTRAIQHMCEIAKQAQVHDSLRRNNASSATDEGADQIELPAVDWQNDTLQINDVFLRFYLRWIHRSEVADG
jgi:hypothetical protein